MNDIFFKASDLEIPIYYSKTDSLLLNRSDMDKLDIIGTKLGDFQVEYDNINYFNILSSNKFIWRFSDGKPERNINMRK